jgi:CelD/BcsL family acetyltransferase involved in cellulose biosynthesis
VRIKTIHPRELDEGYATLWRAHQRANPALQSPYLTPDWAWLIGQVRDDARVCIVEDGEGFLGAQRLSRFAAMGLGAPIADYQGVVARAGLTIPSAALCRALQVGRIDMTHAPSGLTPMTACGEDGSWLAEASGGRDLYEAALRQRRSEFVRQTDKKARKLARDHGDVEFRAASPERADFETLVEWKNAQLLRTGQPGVWTTPWVRRTLDACFDSREQRFGGTLFTIRAGARLAAAAFCLRSHRVLHLWLLAHDPAFDSYSPGVHLVRRIVGWAGDNGLREVDFGPGDYQFKRQLSTSQRTLERGVVTGGSLAGALRCTEYALRARIERLPHRRIAALPGKAMRRLDLVRALHA